MFPKIPDIDYTYMGLCKYFHQISPVFTFTYFQRDSKKHGEGRFGVSHIPKAKASLRAKNL